MHAPLQRVTNRFGCSPAYIMGFDRNMRETTASEMLLVRGQGAFRRLHDYELDVNSSE